MIKIITKELEFDKKLKKKIEFVYDFCNTTPTFINGNIRKLYKTKFKIAYISTVENRNANLTCKNIDFIAQSFNIKVKDLFNEATTLKAKDLPVRDMFKK